MDKSSLRTQILPLVIGIVVIVVSIVFFIGQTPNNEISLKEIQSDISLSQSILNDRDLLEVLDRAKALLGKGLHAGSGYPQVWIRDLNTFIELSCEVNDHKSIKESLVKFYEFQGMNGNIPDGYKEKRSTTHKNTIETDQETSLIQACYKYVHKTGDRSFLNTIVNGKTVLKRMELALEFLLNERFSEKYGLIWGGTTADWGDVQPEDLPGVLLNSNSHKAIDVYDNAMFLIAVKNYTGLVKEDKAVTTRWIAIGEKITENIRKYLWDSKANKFIPHIYLNGSPFPYIYFSGLLIPRYFDESSICYHGGTAVAIEAGLLSREEIAAVLSQMVNNVKKSGAPSIGLTLYPPYPKGFFKNKLLTKPYTYQNGGDWTWFGGRMIQELIKNGFVAEAYHYSKPMITRVLKNDDFYEWYSVNNKPEGVWSYRGSAGVLGKAIQMLLAWAAEVNDTGNNIK